MIPANVEALRKLQQEQNIEIVVTTSRPQSEKAKLSEKLERVGLKIRAYVMDLPHGQRVLVNDFASTNNFPTASAINIPRNSSELASYLQWLER